MGEGVACVAGEQDCGHGTHAGACQGVEDEREREELEAVSE